MSYKRISIRFNLDIEDERNAWELLHSSSCGPINKEVIDSINTAHKLSTLEALLRKVISEELRNISLHIPFEPDTDSASDENESSRQPAFTPCTYITVMSFTSSCISRHL